MSQDVIFHETKKLRGDRRAAKENFAAEMTRRRRRSFNCFL